LLDFRSGPTTRDLQVYRLGLALLNYHMRNGCQVLFFILYRKAHTVVMFFQRIRIRPAVQIPPLQGLCARLTRPKVHKAHTIGRQRQRACMTMRARSGRPCPSFIPSLLVEIPLALPQGQDRPRQCVDGKPRDCSHELATSRQTTRPVKLYAKAHRPSPRIRSAIETARPTGSHVNAVKSSTSALGHYP
jgi:hypothetical protein